jgi:5-formyltetrahydrofolate cyclo-ligase
MTKKEIRKIELDKRIQLLPGELEDKTILIVKQFNGIVKPTTKYLLSYYPIREHNEFDVSICEKIIKETSPSTQIAWPKIASQATDMEAHLIAENKLFIKNRFNILEPLDGDLVAPELLDVIFVPLIAFDKNGFRVGYGKGFYDRYLPRCRRDAIRIGFSFFDPVDRIDDINEFDVPLNLCFTPTCTYEF